MIIGVTGTNGSGKDLVGQMLWEKLGWPHFSLSDEIRQIVQERGLDPSRETLQNLGNELRTQHGPDYLSQKILERGGDNFVATSIRNSHECEPFKTQGNFILIAVDAPVELRFERISARDRANESSQTIENFQREENIEMEGGEFGQQLRKMLEMADYTITNDGTFDELENKVDNLIKEIIK